MKYKGLISVFISFIFLLVIIFTVFSVFTVKSVNVEFEVYASGRSTADIIDEKLSKYKGKNLLFLSTDDVLKEFDDYNKELASCIKKNNEDSVYILDLELKNGAGFIVAKAGKIFSMPGLPKQPAAEIIDLDDENNIIGLY